MDPGCGLIGYFSILNANYHWVVELRTCSSSRGAEWPPLSGCEVEITIIYQRSSPPVAVGLQPQSLRLGTAMWGQYPLAGFSVGQVAQIIFTKKTWYSWTATSRVREADTWLQHVAQHESSNVEKAVRAVNPGRGSATRTNSQIYTGLRL